MPRFAHTFQIRPWELDDLTDAELEGFLRAFAAEDEEARKRRGS